MVKSDFKSTLAKLCIVIAALFTTCMTFLLVDNKTSKQVATVTDPEMRMELSYNQIDENSAKVDNCEFVQFSAYFLRDLNGDGYAEKLDGACNHIGMKDTLYVELDILAQGYLENGKITLSNGNYTWTTSVVEDSVIKGNYIGKTSEITLQDKVMNGTQKIIWGETDSKIYSYITDYSKVNTVTLTGTHVIEDEETGERTETPINKTVNIKVDWYGETRTTLNAPSVTKDPDNLISGDNVVVDFDFTVNETKKELIMQKQIAEVEIPMLNGYAPISVDFLSSYGEAEYNDETRLLTITNSSKEYDNGYVSAISRQNKYIVRVIYPIEAYTEATDEIIYLDIPITAYNYGYNNDTKIEGQSVFENPHMSSDSKTMRILYTKIDTHGYVWNIYPYIGSYEYNSAQHGYRYEISKEYPMDIYNGNIYQDNEDLYLVKWRVDVGTPSAIEKITLSEQKDGDNIKSDELMNLNKVPTSLYDYSTTKGIYFSGVLNALGTNGWIKLYDAETDALIETFTKDNWNQYTESSPYEVNLKSIKIETSNPINKTNLYIYQIKEINDDALTSYMSEESFANHDLIFTYLEGKINAPDGVYYEDGATESTIDKSAYAYYDIPYSMQSISINPTKITNQETVNMDFFINTSKENIIESNWKNGVFLIELPEDFIRFKLNSVQSNNDNVTIKNAFAYKENGKYYVKVYTENDEPCTYSLTINADVDGNPVLATKTTMINLYAYNEECDNYNNKTEDIYEIDGDGLTTDMVGFSSAPLLLNNIGSAGLITTEFVTNYDDNESITIAPNVADIEKSTNDKTATINVSVTNNYTGTLSELDILGKIPYEGNTYTITGGDLGSTYTANITGPINVPEEIESYVTVYYSNKEETNKDLTDSSNGWMTESEVTDWSLVRTYLIDMGDYILDRNENKTFTFDVVVPGGLGYNSASFTHHAVYYYLDTDNGKLAIQTEPNKVGIQVVGKYDMQITKTKVGDATTLIPNATYKAETTDVDGNIITLVGTTNSEGTLILRDLYIDREYTLTEVSVGEEYELSNEEIKFRATMNNSGVLEVNVTSQEQFAVTPEVTTKPSGDFIVKAKLEDEVKYTLKVNKRDENNEPIANVRFTFKANGRTQAYRTDSNGEIIIKGLHLGDTYELKEISADGYYILEETQVFKVVRNGSGVLEVQTENPNSVFSNNITNETLVANIENVKIPTYNLQILKVEENYEEENIENLIPLSGANFLVTSYDNGEQEQFITNSNGLIEINDLYAHVDGKYITGKYVIKEIKAPTGYSNNSEEIELIVTQSIDTTSGTPAITLSADVPNKDSLITFKKVLVEGNTVKLVVEDKPLFQLKKVDSETGEVLANAEFAIYEVDRNENEIGFAKDVNGNYLGTLNSDGLYTVTTDENGIVVLPLKGGIYKAVEVTYPEGYLKLGTEQYFKVADGTENDQAPEDDPDDDPTDESQLTVLEIHYIEDLEALATAVTGGNNYSGYLVKLTNDLDYENPASYRSGEVNPNYIKNGGTRTPMIGNNSYGTSNKFSGVFDGQGHTIKNIYNAPVFGGLANATVRNLTVTGEITNGGDYTGGMSGLAFSSTISNCTNYVTVYGTGGLVGYADGSKFKNCVNYGNVYSRTNNNGKPAGGIAGYSRGASSYYDNCTNYGRMTARGVDCFAGGIISEGKAVITNCVNYGEIVTDCGGYEYDFTYAGGIAGQCEGEITNCINEGTLRCNSDGYHDPPEIGGIVGTAKCNIANCINKADISMINESAGSNYVGGIAGNAGNYTISNSYNTGNIIGGGNSSNYIGGIVGKTGQTTILNSYNTGNITAASTRSSCNNEVGGIVGYEYRSGDVIKNTFNTGDLTTSGGNKGYAGGIVGYVYTPTIENSYNSGDISCTDTTTYAGGILGYLYNNNYTTSDVYYADYIGLNASNINTTGQATDEFMKSDECYEALNEDNVWSKRINNYPVLKKNDMGVLSDVTKITVDNTIKKFKITTEVEGHVGGSISGEGLEPYESVRYAEDSVLPIIMNPNDGYVITKITINGKTVDFVLEDGQVSYQLDQFTNMLEDKHVVVTYTPEDQLLKIIKVDENDASLKLEGAKFKIEEIENRVVTDELNTTMVNSDQIYNIPHIGEEVQGVIGDIQQTSLATYYFVQDGDTYVPNNSGINSSDAVSYFEINLEGLSGQYYLSMDSKVSSESSDYAWATLTDTDTRNLTYLKNTKWINRSGTSYGSEFKTDYCNQVLEGGNKYYLYVGYQKDGSVHTGDDKFTIGAIRINNVTFTQETFGFDLVDGQYISNNQGKDNTYAKGYMVLDLRNASGDYNITVNAETSCGEGDYAYIGYSESPTSVTTNIASIGRTTSAKDYTKKITAGKLYYINFNYWKNASGSVGEDCLKINSVTLSINTDKQYLNIEKTTGAAGEIDLAVTPGRYKITEIEAPTGYRLDSTERIIDVPIGAGATVTIADKKQPKIIVHHYLIGTTNRVAEDEIYMDEVGKEYTTHPHIDLVDLELQKDINDQYVIPDNASGVYTEDDIEVIYYYEADPIELTIKHYLAGTETELATTEKKITPATVTFDGNNYTVTAEDSYDLDTNTNYIDLIRDYELVDIESTIKDDVSIEDTLTYNENSEIIYYYSLKKHTITTEVEPHTEEITNILTGEVESVEVDGGDITGSYNVDYLESNKVKFVEEVEQNNNSTINIIATPDDGYEVDTIKLVSTDDDGISTETVIYGENAESNPEIIATLNNDKTVTLSTFENVIENKHIIVTFKRASDYEYTVNYLDRYTHEKIHTSKVQGDMEYGATVLSVNEIIDIENYEYYSVDKEYITIETDSTRNVINIYYTPFGSIEISKKDSSSNNLVANAVFGIYSDSACENLVREVTTLANGKVVADHLELGTYYVKEITPPQYYELSTEIKTAVVRDATNVVTVEITNIPLGYIQIEKVDASSGMHLENAVYGLYRNQNCTDLVQRLITNANGTAKTDLIPVGTYYLKEITAPANYTLDTSVQTCSVVRAGETTTVNLEDTAYSAQIEVIKKDLISGQTVEKAGTKFIVNRITTNNGELDGEITNRERVTVTSGSTTYGTDSNPFETDSTGKYTLSAQDAGMFEIVEVEAPDGYALSGYEAYTEDGEINSGYLNGGTAHAVQTPIRIEITGDGTQSTAGKVTVELKDAPKTGTLKLYKSGEHLKSARANNERVYVSTYETGAIQNAVFSVYAEEDIYTVDGHNTKIYSANEKIADITTGSDGYAYIDNLPLGKYYVRETTAGDGFVLNTEVKHFEISDDTLEDDELVEDEAQKTAVNIEDVSYVNERQKVEVTVLKVDSEDDTIKLEGVIFGLYAKENILDKDGNIVIRKDSLVDKATTNVDGLATFTKDIPLGMYYVKEIETIYGYSKIESEFEVDATYAGQTVSTITKSITVANELKETDVIVHYYIYGTTTRVPDINGDEIEDIIIPGKVGDSYTTTSSDEVPVYYEFVESTDNTSGEMEEDRIEVIYYYRLKSYSGLVKYLEKDNDTDDSNNKVLHDPKALENQTYGTNILASNEVIDIEGYVYDSCDKDILTIGTNPSENILTLYYTKGTFGYEVHYFYDGVEDENEVEHGTATYQDIIDYDDVIDNFGDKIRPGYDLTDYNPVDNNGDLALEISADPTQNVINIYYRTKYTVETAVKPHDETSKDGTTTTVYGGKIYESSGVEHSVETVYKYDDSTKSIIITPDTGYEIVSIKIKDGKDAEEETNVNLSDVVSSSGIATLKASNGYFTNMQSDKYVEVEFRKKSKVIVKYLSATETDDNGNPVVLAEQETINGYETKDFETQRKPVTYYKSSSKGVTDENDDNITNYDRVSLNSSGNAVGTMYSDTLTVIYWYERVPSGILVKHIEITEADKDNGLTLESGTILDSEVIPGYVSLTETTHRNTYENYISVDGPTSSSENIIIAANTEDSVVAEYKELEDGADYVVEVRYYYEKQYKVSTEVKPHDENGTPVNGGHITGEGQEYEEIINKLGYNHNAIICTPDSGYRVKSITINDVSIDLETLDEDSSHRITLPVRFFDEVDENKHVVVEFERIPAKVIAKYKDIDTDEEIADEETQDGYVNDPYETESKDIDDYILIDDEPEGHEGTMKEEDIIVIYYYRKQFKITTDVVEHDEPIHPSIELPKDGDQIIEIISAKGGSISGEDMAPYETVIRGGTSQKEITMKADEYYRIVSVTINGEEVEIEDDEGFTLAQFEDIQEDKHIVVKYERKPATLIVRYLELDTENVLADEEFATGYYGEGYRTFDKKIDGYELVKVIGDSIGTLETDETFVTYYYKKIEKKKGPIDGVIDNIINKLVPKTGDNIILYASMLIVSSVGLIIVIKRRK